MNRKPVEESFRGAKGDDVLAATGRLNEETFRGAKGDDFSRSEKKEQSP
jgi:hypothetical protein